MNTMKSTEINLLHNTLRTVFVGILDNHQIELIWEERNRIIDRRCDAKMNPETSQEIIDILGNHAELENWLTNNFHIDFVSPSCHCNICKFEKTIHAYISTSKLRIQYNSMTRNQRLQEIKNLQRLFKSAIEINPCSK